MHTILRGILPTDDVEKVCELLRDGTYVDGRVTSAVVGKSNLQLPVEDAIAAAAGQIVITAMQRCAELKRIALPKSIHPPLFSRYDATMTYPDHVDVALMGGLRTDIAVTVFLSDLDSYEGGELVVDTRGGMRRFRLAAGDAVVYDATTVHRVETVRSGVRLAAVTWIQSFVKDAAQRRLLVELAGARDDLADTAAGPRLRRAYESLVRMWAEC